MLRARHDHRRRLVSEHDGMGKLAADLKLDLLRLEREVIYQMLRDGKITDDARRRLERELDLEEAAVLLRRDDEGLPPAPL
jgi:CPA1 family monovalent cation:H+ antiporter